MHPSKVFQLPPDLTSSFRSQEPRRPRFSFFYLHNVNELTRQTPRHERTKAPQKIHSGNSSSSPVARQPPCPEKKTPISGSHKSSRRQREPGYMKAEPDCQLPFSDFCKLPNQEKLAKPKTHSRSFFNPSSGLLQSGSPFSGSLCSGERYIGAPDSAVNPVVHKTDKQHIPPTRLVENLAENCSQAGTCGTREPADCSIYLSSRA